MKNAMKFVTIALGLFIIAISCESVNISIDKSQAEKNYRTFTVVFPEQIDSKVSIAADGKTAWEVGDQIFIHGQKVGHSGDEYYSRTVTLAAENISVDGKTATFTMEDILADKSWGRTGYSANLFAAYPASAIQSYVDADSWYYTSAFTKTNTLLLAGCNDVAVNEGNTFQFMNLSGVLSFVVSGDYDSYIFNGNGGTEVVGYDCFSVRVDADDVFGDKLDIPHSSGSGPLTSGSQTTLTGDVVSDGSTLNYIYFPGGVNLANGFTIKFVKGGEIKKTLSTSVARNIAMGKYLQLGDVTSHLKTYSAPKHDATSPAIAGATDLSASGAANCYIVDGSDAGNANKVFKFKAYKGNSTQNAGTIDSVEILWETYNAAGEVTANSVIAKVDFDKQNENEYYEICFQMPASLHAGNAVIAAKNDSDIILWSWHIWVPSSTIADYANDAFCGTGIEIMDRNLGALESVVAGTSDVPSTSFGLYYQWGRKDPFILSEWGRNASVSFSVNSSWVSTETAVQNPTVFYKQNDKGTTPATYNWNSSEITTLWEDSGKTIYDPCPVGYRVDVFNSSDRMWKYDNTEGWEANTTYGWLKFGSITFPLSGYTETLSGYKIKERALLWSASYLSLERASALYTSALPSYPSYYKYYGASVRCVTVD